MKRSKDEHRRRWRAKWIELGMDALKALSMDGPKHHKAEMVVNLPAQIDQLIDRMYDDLDDTPKPALDGQRKVTT